MKKWRLVLVVVMSFAFVTTCLAMGKLDTQKTQSGSQSAPEVEAYSEPVEVQKVEEAVSADTEAVQEVAADVQAEAVQEVAEVVETEPVQEAAAAVEQEAAASSSSMLEGLGVALDEFNALATAQDKVNFLLAKANEFYASEQFQKTVDAAQYVLQYLDAESQPAKDLVAMAKDKLVEMASQKIEDVGQAISGTASSVTDAIGTVGQ